MSSKKNKPKTLKPKIRAQLPPNKRHKSKKQYKRNNKVKDYDKE